MSQADPGLATAENRDWLRICAYSGSEARWGVPLVSMVNTTNAGQSDNLGRGCRPALDFARFKGALFQRQNPALLEHRRHHKTHPELLWCRRQLNTVGAHPDV